MSEKSAPALPFEQDGNAFPFRYLWASCLIVASQVGTLMFLERRLFCSCGEIRLWQGTLHPLQNSQQLTDPYTFLHFAFGAGLFLWLTAIRSHWHIVRRAAYAILSSALWEICENLPTVIRVFGEHGSDLHYAGDSIANSLSDTVAC